MRSLCERRLPVSLLQVQSPVDSDALSPVERTAAWVLSNGQYEEAEEDSEQNADGVKHAEKVGFICTPPTRGLQRVPSTHS